MLYIIQISNNSYNEGNMSNNSYNEGTMSKIIYANLGVKSSVRTSTIQRAALKLSKVYFDTFKVKYKKLSDFLCIFKNVMYDVMYFQLAFGLMKIITKYNEILRIFCLYIWK